MSDPVKNIPGFIKFKELVPDEQGWFQSGDWGSIPLHTELEVLYQDGSTGIAQHTLVGGGPGGYYEWVPEIEKRVTHWKPIKNTP